jgi:hypothetical protein
LIALVVSLFLESLARCSRSQACSSVINGPTALLTVEFALDGEQDVDALDRLGRDRRLAEPCQIEELAPAVRSVRSFDNRTWLAIGLVELAEAGIGVGLHQSGITRQMQFRMLSATIRRVEEHGRRWIGAAKRAIVAS